MREEGRGAAGGKVVVIRYPIQWCGLREREREQFSTIPLLL